MALQQVLGVSQLKGKDGNVNVSSIEGKTLLIYFSAHWCPPCRQFTPVLAEWYRKLQAKRQDFEIVFNSWDKTQSEFDEYYEEHPWLAIPFSESKARDALTKKHKVESIPTMVVINPDGSLGSTKARNKVLEDPEGANFPWTPRPLMDVIGDLKITSKSGATLTIADLQKLDSFAIYFSAHWCPPCRAFTPKLASLYQQIQSAGKVKTEFIFVSSDKTEGEFDDYYADMPWAKAAFADRKAAAALKDACEVEGIPTLVTIDGKTGTMLNKDARGVAAEDEDGSLYPWTPIPLEAINPLKPRDRTLEALNSEMCVILATNNAPNKDTALVEFTKAAEKFDATVNKPNDYDDAIRFFAAQTEEEQMLFGRILQATQTAAPAEGKVTVIAINMQTRGKALFSGEISADAVFDFAMTFKGQQS